MGQVANLYDEAAEASRLSLKKMNRAARRGLDQLSDGMEDARDAVRPVLRKARAQMTDATSRGVGYVRDEPVRTALAVVAAGALVYGLMRLLSPRSAD